MACNNSTTHWGPGDLSPDATHINNLGMENDKPMKISRNILSDCDSVTPSKKSAVANNNKKREDDDSEDDKDNDDLDNDNDY
jgi:hypothetical protein